MRPGILIQRLLLHCRVEAPLSIETKARRLEENRKKKKKKTYLYLRLNE
jgi:hypothetical protein